ncbi:MAG TPA: hypothetical protein VN231_07370 [Allosphingosinicella sp.]|nr:hypothetical protein [Allosphingosinicella sp.]
MSALLALLLALGSVEIASSGDREMLDAFRAACERADDLERMRSDALASGWEEIPASADPRVERLNRSGREMVGEEGGRITGANFRRTLGDRRLFLILSRWEGEDGIWGNGCRLYHFEAGEEIAPAALEAWIGRPPTGVQQLPGIGVKRLWEPGWRDGVSLEINHIPANSEIVERFGLSGNILVAQAIGGF